MAAKSPSQNSVHSKIQLKSLKCQFSADGKRKVGRPSYMNEGIVRAIRFLYYDCKIGKRKIATILGVGVSSIFRVLSEA